MVLLNSAPFTSGCLLELKSVFYNLSELYVWANSLGRIYLLEGGRREKVLDWISLFAYSPTLDEVMLFGLFLEGVALTELKSSDCFLDLFIYLFI